MVILSLCIGTSTMAQTTNQSILKGNEYYRMGQFEQAEKEYSEAVKSSPGNNTARYNLAGATFRMGKETDAIKSYEEIAAYEKDAMLKSKAYYNKGSILSKQKKVEESVELYKNVLRSNPNDKEARENLQKALLELKKKEPPKKKEEEKKQKQQQQKPKPQPRLNQKEAEQRLKLLEQKEKEIQQRMQKEKSKSGGGQVKDW